MTSRQQVVWIPKGDPNDKVAKVETKPWRVWTMSAHVDQEVPPQLPIVPVHCYRSFMEDYVHDWMWKKGILRYYSRISNGGVWVLLEFKSEET